MELSTTEGQLCISVEANTVRLPLTTLEDFDLSPLVLRRFCCDPDAVLDPSSTGGAIWCHVLPSMKKGQIITISRQLPKDGPFRTYRDLQNHWNHLYGYRLPDLAEEEVVYCSVYFRLVGDRLFTYPLSCIRLQPVQRLPRVDLQGALGCFLSDIRDRLQSVCGFPAQLTGKPCYRSVGLHAAATVQMLSGDQINLTSTCSIRQVLTQLPPPPHPRPVQTRFGSQSSAWTPLSQQDGVQRILGNGFKGRLTQSQSCQRDEVWPSFSSSSSSSSCTLVSSSPFSSVFQPASSLSFSSSSSFTLPPPLPPPPKLVPIFRNKCPSRHVNVAVLRAQKQREQLIGGEREKRRVSFSVVHKQTPTPTTPTSTTSSSSSVSAAPHPPTVPHFDPRPKPQSSSFPGHQKLKQLFSFSPASKSKPAPAPSPGPEIQSEPESSYKTSMRASFGGNLQEEATKAAEDPAENCEGHTDGAGFESTMKKKSKSVRRVADVEKMARSGQLSKLSSASLLTWLKARGATVSAKHKKEELMLKVMSCLAES
ncbi:ras-associated and pleckstrin homology domains-containing protein 1-like [Xyrichtys novacula]|nr:ras-associated and pleckstrin homology domains-containing protein 1-like [Xyrichtys novacula]